ncbi:NAD-glutamate dehydrogenase [Dongia soli]|uniref:NAD-glutamate dehydrogenase n=1 Tax=Dongia soli TaxID=600628 RepID=A0ABU5E8L9_9PROT|nr:NAD-glutamate dehydrogenase [Dongia soli]MDY0882262.1 NAD-glutamate dehydrogenase [Dongia soli]
MKADKLKLQLIDDVVHFVNDRIERNRVPLVESFIRQFYANVPQHDLADQNPEDLFCAALSLWNFAAKRPANGAKVRVFNPKQDEHGWDIGHSIVEIVNDDMPFLVDSVNAELNRQDVGVHLVIHPVMRVERDAKGQLVSLGKADAPAESIMQLHVTQIGDAARCGQIRERIEVILKDVRLAVQDWPQMKARLDEVIEDIAKRKLPMPKEEVSEIVDFLRWAGDNNFTFLGYREYTFSGEGEQVSYRIQESASLGILRDFNTRVFDGIRNRDNMPPDVRNFIRQPNLMMVTKANLRSTVHRNSYLDTIGVKFFDKKGEVAGERLFAGLFTSIAYNRSPWQIPLLRRKVENITRRAGFDPDSHDGKALAHILDTYPRDELFQSAEDELMETALGILHLQERQRVALFARRDPYERFVSCLVYLPRDMLNTALRLRIGAVLSKGFNGQITASYVHVGDGPLARLQYIVNTTPGEVPAVDLKELEDEVAEASRSWRDKLHDALVEAKGEAKGIGLLRRFGDAFPAGYEEFFSAYNAVHDIDRIEEALQRTAPALNLYRPIEVPANELHLKLYKSGEKIALSTVLPSLENFGLKVISENPFEVRPHGGETPVWIHDFVMATADGAEVDISQIRDQFQEAYAKIWGGEMEDDGFNRLIITAGLAWRDITLLRAYCKYLRQAAIAFSQAYMEATLNGNPQITRNIVKLFHIELDPGYIGDRKTVSEQIVAEIQKQLDAVSNLDEDRILRRFLNAVQSTLRTNFFQRAADGGVKEYLSFKLDSHNIEDLPLPRPMVEVFVYSPRAEAIHLRGGKVARGGIRWSDRREDFRTEVLGLMKAQMVKNAVIVPVGSKGGFVVKRPPQTTDRDVVMAEVIYCYKTLMRGLLDITDNLVGGKVVPPGDVVRRDGDDPYLVVAADKGTATFSDIANGVSRDYGFWLDDAFASGGSAGYDHKKMGITARGAWESVKRHFREIGLDIQSVDYSCVGVGDMSGDVFGNGMLLSRHTQLVGAFNHMHIFVDPNPDVAASFRERERLFNLPRSTWADYDSKLVSAGGGIYERKAKSIKLSPEARARFGISKESVTPNELIQAMLKAEVDLLWLGGIGTYVKAGDETHAEVGDRANDAIRINADQLRCKVVGEGANLGFTQRGRIEAGLAGKCINTDALDNSAGVDTSDHEVNIKILLNEAVANGDLTMKQRDKLLADMTDEVGNLVLRDNYLQSQAISIAEYQSFRLLDQQGRFMRGLERAGRLDRAIEFLPDDETMRLRLSQRLGLTRPELSVLLAYAKNSLYDELLPSDLPDDPQLADDLITYFPRPLQKSYREQIEQHRLRREIIATVVTNSLVNRMGATFAHVMKEKTGQSASAIARAYTITRSAFKLREVWSGVEALDNKVDAKVQTDMLLTVGNLADQATLWFLRNGQHPLNIAANVAATEPSLAALEAALPTIVSPADQAEISRRLNDLTAQNVPADLARRVAQLALMMPALDIVRIAADLQIKVEEVGQTYFAIGDQFYLDWLRSGAKSLIGDSHWQRLAVFAIIEDLYGHQRELTTVILKGGQEAKPKLTGQPAIDHWREARGAVLGRADSLFADLKQAAKLELAMLAVANRTLRSLIA